MRPVRVAIFIQHFEAHELHGNSDLDSFNRTLTLLRRFFHSFSSNLHHFSSCNGYDYTGLNAINISCKLGLNGKVGSDTNLGEWRPTATCETGFTGAAVKMDRRRDNVSRGLILAYIYKPVRKSAEVN